MWAPIQVGVAVIGLIASVQPSLAQRAEIEFSTQTTAVQSGLHDGAERTTVAFEDVISSPGAAWVRLHISDYNLGDESFIIIRSQFDGGEQRLDASSLSLWQNATAVFNGDAVEVELHAAPGETGLFVNFDEILSGDPTEIGPMTICGASDNRVASTDNRVGRLFFGGCTAWYITNGAFLTAGHCADFDPAGPGLPDGVLDLSGVVEFNIPQSSATGAPLAANPNDQYPILVSTVVWNFDGVNSIGEDWAVFEVGPNSTTNLMPWEAYNLIGWRPSRENPDADDTIRVTGCGVDNTPAGPGGAGAPCCTRDSMGNCTFDCNSNHFTLQREDGPFDQQVMDSFNDISLEYSVDTMGGNSGSPVIWLSTSPDVAIGIHTNGGCTSGGGANSGTAFEVDALEIAVRNVTSSAAKFVDAGHPYAVSLGNGTIYRPYDTITEGLVNVVNGGIVSIVAGTYGSGVGSTILAGTDGKAFVIEAPVGSVVINP